MSKVIELLSKYLLIPLLREGYKYIAEWVTNYFRKRALEKKNKEKVEAYKESDNVVDAADDFTKLP